MTEIFLRNSTLADVDVKQRLVDLIAVPWEEEADVFWRGELWRESFERGAFDGIETHAGRVRVNREHVVGDTVGKVVAFEPSHSVGLWTRVKIAATTRGDDTLALADEDMISASIGYRVNQPDHVDVNKRTRLRRVHKAFLEHLAMCEAPTWAKAEVLAVRADQSPLEVMETPLPQSPVLDDYQNDEVFQWARQRANI